MSLTKAGKVRITAAFDHHKRSMDRAAGGLSKEERTTLIALVKKLGIGAEQLQERND